ncbi:MAG TPA: alpha/beta hydrolase family protein [Phycisphaerae bacterium]|nr:alpha/beta hydrolase family protein [Phycisphaerae bacterium]
MVTFMYEFPDRQAVVFEPILSADRARQPRPTSQPGDCAFRVGDMDVRIDAVGVEIRGQHGRLWRAELIAPARKWTVAPTAEVIARGNYFVWARLLVPDEHWPRIIEVRADALGTVAIRAHVQRLEPTEHVVARAPDIGWRIDGPTVEALRSGGVEKKAGDGRLEHSFAKGEPAMLLAGNERLDFPDAHLFRRGWLMVEGTGDRAAIEYLRCRTSEQVPMQYAVWRTAAFVVGPRLNAPWNALLEPSHATRIAPEAFDAIYGSGTPPDLSPWGLLDAVNRYHIDAIARSTLPGDDFGNVSSMPTSGVYGMNRLNHCPPIFETYYRTGDARVRHVALHWCENYHDLSIWWGTTGNRRFGGTRYNNASRHDKSVPADPDFMWRSNFSVDFCTKGIDSFLYAYEETGDPRMATALRWQWDYARQEVHAYRECRNIGDVMDFVRLYRFTGDRSCLEEALRLFRELRTKLWDNNLFSQGGEPPSSDLTFIEDDADGSKYGYAKPYIIGYALLGLPALAGYLPEEPRLHDVVRAVADFQAGAQNPVGGWAYPHPRSSGASLSIAMECAVQLSRAAAYLESRGENIESLLDAIERGLRQRILAWERKGKFILGLGGWEAAAGLLKDGKRLSEMYRTPEDRDRSRDYTEGQLSFGDAPPEGVVYFFEVLKFYLSHRPAERLFHANEPLQKVLARIPADNAAYQAPEPSGEYLRYGLAEQLPTFREHLLQRLTFPMAWDPASGMDYATWRRQARAKVFECLLAPPPRADFAPVVIGREDRGSYEARKVVFNVSADCRILAYLLVPKGKGPFPAIVALHDHGAFFLIGKEKMVRPFDVRPEIVETAREWVEKTYGGRFVGDMLAERGYVVFSADALFWGDRGRKEGVDYNQQQALAGNLLQMGTTWLATIAWDDIRSAEFVASLPEVDPRRIGAIGLSMGCHRTWMLHALSDRVAAAVGVCWMCTTHALMTPGNNQTKGHSAYSMLPPNLRNFLDYPDVASIACPKPLLLYDGGEKDKLFPVPGVDEAYARMHRIWDSQGVGDRLLTKRWDLGHVLNVEMQEEAFGWLDRWLRKPT